MQERLQKILAQWGIASRRQAEQMILDGRVRLNGAIVNLGQKADTALDCIEVDGRAVQPARRPQPVYLLLHKPAGILSTCCDPWGRPTVLDLLPSSQQAGLHPVGRLDIQTTGALLLTNDGRLTYCLTHPRHHVSKTYQVWVQGHPSESVLQVWRDGVVLSDQLTLPAEVRVLELATKAQTKLEVVLREGRNRQIRRIAEQLGYPVLRLHRTAIGPVQLQAEGGELPCGYYRRLMTTELEFLRNLIGIVGGNPQDQISDKECQV